METEFGLYLLKTLANEENIEENGILKIKSPKEIMFLEEKKKLVGGLTNIGKLFLAVSAERTIQQHLTFITKTKAKRSLE